MLTERLSALCDDCRERLPEGPARERLDGIRAQLREPLRIAVAGRVSSGKSTLVNALLGLRVAPTAAGECTQVVTWYRYSETDRAEIRLVDGTTRPLALDADRSLPEDLGVDLELVDSIQVGLYVDALERLTLIDTPGLASLSGASARTEDLLARRSEDAVARADALVYVVAGDLRADDERVLTQFQDNSGPLRASLMNTVAVLNKVDKLGRDPDEIQATTATLVRSWADTLRHQVGTIVPLSALLAETAEAARLTEGHARTLDRLAALPDTDRERLLLSADRLGREDSELLARLDLFGTRVALGRIDAGERGGAALTRALRAHSGFAELGRVLHAVFARRADILKADVALTALRGLADEAAWLAQLLLEWSEQVAIEPEAQALRVGELLHQVSRGELELARGARGRARAHGTGDDHARPAGARRGCPRRRAQAGRPALRRRLAHVRERQPAEPRAGPGGPDRRRRLQRPGPRAGGASRVSAQPVTAEPPLIDRVLAIAHERGREDVCEALAAARVLRRDTAATVVVAGETRRGKSSFVNALLETEVTAAGLPTATHVLVRHAPAPRALAHRREHAPEAIALSEIGAWSGSSPPADDVVGIEVGIDHPLLAQGLEIVDTPGAGGLNAAHAEITLAALARADALIFVLEAEAPLSRTELDFLEEAGRRVSTVVFLLTKIDASPGWETLLEESRQLIRTHAPAYADRSILPLSSVIKQHGIRGDDPELLAESRFAAVEQMLSTSVIGRARRLRAANLARQVRTELDRLDEGDRAALAAPDDVADSIDEAVECERAFMREADRAQGALGLEFQRAVANPVNLELRRRVRRLQRRYEARIVAREVDAEGLEAELPSEIAALTAELQETLRGCTRDLLARAADDLGLPLDAVTAQLDAVSAPVDFAELDATVALASDPWFSRRMNDAGQAMRASFYARSLALILGPVGLVAGLAVGALGWGGSAWLKRVTQGEREVRAMLGRVVEALLVEMDAALRGELLYAQRVAQEELRTAVDRRRAELARLVKQARETATRTRDEREELRRAAKQRLAETEPLHRAALALEARAREESGR